MPFLLAELLSFQGSMLYLGVGSFSYLGVQLHYTIYHLKILARNHGNRTV